MKDTIEKILIGIVLLGVGLAIGRWLLAPKPADPVLVVERDSTALKAVTVRADSLQGRLEISLQRFSLEQRASASWKRRSAAWEALAESLKANAPILPAIVAVLDTTVDSAELDSLGNITGRFRDSVRVVYDVVPDVWRDFRLALAGRPVKFKEVIRYLPSPAAAPSSTPWTLISIVGGVLVLLGFFLGMRL